MRFNVHHLLFGHNYRRNVSSTIRFRIFTQKLRVYSLSLYFSLSLGAEHAYIELEEREKEGDNFRVTRARRDSPRGASSSP